MMENRIGLSSVAEYTFSMTSLSERLGRWPEPTQSCVTVRLAVWLHPKPGYLPALQGGLLWLRHRGQYGVCCGSVSQGLLKHLP